MANTVAPLRLHLIYGVCLPLALLLGYMLAEPLDSTSMGLVLLVFSVLAVPLLMQWYHPMLIMSWNACISPYMLPGRPYLWMLMVLASGVFALLARATNPTNKRVPSPTIARSLFAVLIVVLVTAFATGGAGFHSLGAIKSYGGKFYIYILLAVAGYFVFTCKPIPDNRAMLYLGLFFLPGITAVISNLVYMAGPNFYFLFDLFPPDLAVTQAQGENSTYEVAVRITGLVSASLAIWCFLLGRYGINGIFDLTRPWRGIIFIGAIGAGLLGGFRSSFVYFLMVFSILFILQGLWRTKTLFIVLTAAVLSFGGLAYYAEQMPLSVQRAVSFLPISVNPAAKMDADASVDWRLDMWRKLLPEVPQYLFKGKGYMINPTDLYLMEESVARGYVSSADVAALAGDYHNGPLSIIIPFGIWGVLAFGWFFLASVRVLFRAYHYGRPEHFNLNSLLLALFLARLLAFCFVAGSIYADMAYFVGLVGFSVALNGELRQPVAVAEPKKISAVEMTT